MGPYVDALRQQSARRIAADKDFAYLAAEVARLKQRLSTKSVSPNEADRRRELARDKARHEERGREDQALHTTRPTTYVVTLENASLPGLPPPAAFTNEPSKSSSSGSSTTDLDASPSARSPAADIIFNESERILADYVDLLTSARSLLY